MGGDGSLTFMCILADVSFSTEALTIIGTMGAGMIAAITMLFKLLMASKDKALVDMTSARDSFKEIADESVTSVESIVNRMRAEKGEEEFKPMKAIVPEHASPIKQSQQDTADLQTMRARLVAATLNLHLPAREASRPATPTEEKQLKT